MNNNSRETNATKMFWAIVAALALAVAMVAIPESDSKLIWMAAVGVLSVGFLKISKAPRWFIELYTKRSN